VSNTQYPIPNASVLSSIMPFSLAVSSFTKTQTFWSTILTSDLILAAFSEPIGNDNNNDMKRQHIVIAICHSLAI
jgi:hypothetical protein